jgi:hypothetical protein
MCGNDSSIRIKRVGNGFTIDAYTPGGKDKPGKHLESVATKPEHVLRAVASHIGAKGRRRGSKGLVVMNEGESSAPRSGRKARRKGAARKRAA